MMLSRVRKFNLLVYVVTLIFGLDLAALKLVHAETSNIPNPDALHSKVLEFNKDYLAGDFRTIFSMFPPRIFGDEAKKHGTTVEFALDLAAKEIGAKFAKQVKVFSYVVDDSHPRTVALTNGTNGTLLPSVSVLEILEKNKKVQLKSEVVAINEAGTWYLVPLAASWAYQGLVSSYPEYKGLKFESSSTELKD